MQQFKNRIGSKSWIMNHNAVWEWVMEAGDDYKDATAKSDKVTESFGWICWIVKVCVCK